MGYAVLAPELTISILPRRLAQAVSSFVSNLNGWSGIPIPDWCGIPCEIAEFKLHTRALQLPQRNFQVPLVLDVRVRIPSRHEPWMPDYLLLGSQFIKEKRAEIHLDCSTSPNYNPRYVNSCGELILN